MTGRIPYGGDYNPEQWPQDVWDEDHRLFGQAGIDTLTVGVFSWSLTQPAEETYDFTVLDRILDRAAAEGRQVCLATGTAALPPWLARKYPEVNRTDFEGRRHRYGQRHNFCPSSPAYRRLSTAMSGHLAERYADHPALLAWHINNEYGGVCYCGLCADAFRNWLRDQYGTLDALNDAWWTTFWSHRYTDWAESEPPSALTEHWRGPDHTAFQGITLDYFRFTTDALLGCFLAEKEAIRSHDPETPVTTNFMGMFRPLDYHRWAPHLDFASWDSYPPLDAPPTWPALAHDLMRGLKDGAPFWVMEQTPSTTACRDVNPLRRPGSFASPPSRPSPTAPTPPSTSSCAPPAGPARSTTGRSSATPDATTPASSAKWPTWGGSCISSATRPWAPAPPPAPPSSSTGTAGGPWRSPTAPPGW